MIRRAFVIRIRIDAHHPVDLGLPRVPRLLSTKAIFAVVVVLGQARRHPMLSAVAKRNVFFELFRTRADSQSLGFRRGRFRHLDPRIERHALCDLA